MDGPMDGEMDGQTIGWMEQWMDRLTTVYTIYTSENGDFPTDFAIFTKPSRTNQRTHRLTDQQTDQWTDIPSYR